LKVGGIEKTQHGFLFLASKPHAMQRKKPTTDQLLPFKKAAYYFRLPPTKQIKLIPTDV